MFKNLSLKVKLITIFILIGLVPFGVIAIVSLNNSSAEIEAQIKDKLKAVEEIKANQLESFFDERKGDISVLSDNRELIHAMQAYEKGYNNGGLNSQDWSSADAEYNEFLSYYTNQYGYYDLFLIDNAGNVVYTVAKEADLGKNVSTGQLSDSPLNEAYREASSGISIIDFAWYSISEEPAAFISKEIRDENNTRIGVLVYQLSLDSINAIMQERSGMGETGETYLVGEDKLMRSDSFLDPENHSVLASFQNPSRGSVDTEAVQKALRGQSGIEIITDYNGNPVLSAYRPINLDGFTWVILAEMDEAEAFESVNQLTTLIIIMSIVIAALVLIIAFLFANSIEKPINRIVESLFDSSDQVASASEELSSASQQLAEGSSEQASSLEETSATLNESNSMIQQSTDNTEKATEISENASSSSERGREQMDRMMKAMKQINDSSGEISKIIKVIDDIAFQTNILALNAAVEAARAGEAGAGFAVVAEEVRNLAQRSAKAASDTTDIIEKNIELSKEGLGEAEKVHESLVEINEQAGQLNKLVEEINAASKEQSQGISQINEAMSQMEQVTQQNAANAEETASSSEEMSAQAETLNEIVKELNELIKSAAEARKAEGSHSGTSGKKKQPGKQPSSSGSQRKPKLGSNKGSRNTQMQKSGKQTHAVNPEDVIPLDEDSQDF